MFNRYTMLLFSLLLVSMPTFSATPAKSATPTRSVTPAVSKPATLPPKPVSKPALTKPPLKPLAKPTKKPFAGKAPLATNAVALPADNRFGGPKSKEELQKTRENYQAQVLKGQPDPYKNLMADSEIKSIAGPAGSNLAAMVKVRPSVGTGYRHEANEELANNPALQQQLTTRFSQEQPELQGQFVPPQKNNHGQYVKPYVLRSDGSKVELEWHHSPNHVGTVSLIPKETHRLGEGGMGRLHYLDPQTGRPQGGNHLYTVPPPATQPDRAPE